MTSKRSTELGDTRILKERRKMTCDFPKVFQYTFSRLVLWNRTNKQAVVCYRYANTQVLAGADFVVIALKESKFVSNFKKRTAIAITIKKINVFVVCFFFVWI